MDSGFDDLLGPSRSALEDNPFSNPFSNRSSSPDPWATPFAQPADDDIFNSPFTGQPAPTTPTSAHGNDNDEHDEAITTPTATSAALADPLDSANLPPDDDDDDNEPLGRRKSTIIVPTDPSPPHHSPGFRESVASFSEIATIRPTGPEETIPAPNSPAPVVPESPPPNSAQPVHVKSASLSRSAVLPSPTKAEWGPLDKPSAVSHSFSDLALGGESAGGGWGGDQENWSNDRAESRFPSEEDSDDDKPISQIVQEASKPGSPRMGNASRKELAPVFVISVDDPQKVGDPIRSFTLYTVHTRTTSPLFQKSAFSVLRRYSDFLWLYETLSNNNPGVFVPPVPDKNTFGRFDDQFVRQRRFALEKCIQKIANHPVLGKDADLKIFLESDTFSLNIKHRKAELANERGGLMASIGQSLAGPRFYETDDWFDRQKGYLDSLESQLRGLVKAIETVSRHRLELGTVTGEFAQSVSDLSASDVGRQLSQSLAGLADVERTAQDLQNLQSDQDMVTLMGTVDEYARLINSVRLTFTSRIRIYHNWKKADEQLLMVKQNHERNRAQGRIAPDRLGYSLAQVADAERRALDAKHEFEHVSKLIKAELARFEQERIEDFKDSLHAFLEGMISRQKELIGFWENYQQMLLKRVGGGRGLPNSPTTAEYPA